MNALSKGLAFLRRDLLLQSSYRASFVLNIVGIFFSVAIFYYLGKLIGPAVEGRLGGTDYFSFVLVGIAFYNFLGTALNSFSGSLRQAQLTGTLEPVLVTPVGIPTLLFGSSLYSFLYTSLTAVAYLIVAALFFDFDLSRANLGAACLTLLLTVVAFSGLGILSASFTLRWKRGDPLAFFLGTASALLGGVYFPVEVIPGWLQKVAAWIPLTYALSAMRGAILEGAATSALSRDLLVLALFAAVLVPLSVLAFSLALRAARRDGTLGQY
ncbi:MAG: ABC transporter permease [Deltaproteobacteria bacterium]|nr:ABC transporter permease [Deltaproteobacteria bacterium]